MRSSNGLFPTLMGVLILGLAVVLFFVVAPQQDAAAAHIASVPYQLGIVSDLTPGAEVIVTGVLRSSELVPGTDADINAIVTDLNLLAYEVDRFSVSQQTGSDDITKYVGSWQTITRMLPLMEIETGSSTFTIEASSVAIQRPSQEAILPQRQEYRFVSERDMENGVNACENPTGKDARGWRCPVHGPSAPYKDTHLLPGSRRVRGAAEGDTLTVYGTLTSRGVVQPKMLVCGEREALLEVMNGMSFQTRMGGLLAILIGGTFFLYGVSQR